MHPDDPPMSPLCGLARIISSVEDFSETFPDNGPTDMIEVLCTYHEIGYHGFVRVDHVPLLATESGEYDGYGMQGHIFATGYLKGLMEPIFGKPTAV